MSRVDAVVVHHTFPSSIAYETARPAALLSEMGVGVHIVDVGPVGRTQLDGVPYWREATLRSVMSRVARLRPRLIYLEAPGPQMALVALPGKSWVRAPMISAQPAKRAVQRRLLRRADVVSFTNPGEASRWSVADAHRADLPYPVDVTFWSTTVERDSTFWTTRDLAVPTGPVLASVSNILQRKRPVELLEALVPELAARPSVRLVFAGRTFEPEVEQRLRAVIAGADLGAQVQLLGGLSKGDMRQLYAWSSVGVLNTELETQCMALYEGLAAGVPVLFPDIPELTSAFPDAPAHRDALQLRQNVARALDDPSWLAGLPAQSASQLAWSDVRHHDELFTTWARRLLSGQTTAS